MRRVMVREPFWVRACGCSAAQARLLLELERTTEPATEAAMRDTPSEPWNATFLLPASAMRTGWRTSGERIFRTRYGRTFRMTVVMMTPRLHKPLNRITYLLLGATWRSGYATVCKTVNTGSIPVVASTCKIHKR